MSSAICVLVLPPSPPLVPLIIVGDEGDKVDVDVDDEGEKVEVDVDDGEGIVKGDAARVKEEEMGDAAEEEEEEGEGEGEAVDEDDDGDDRANASMAVFINRVVGRKFLAPLFRKCDSPSSSHDVPFPPPPPPPPRPFALLDVPLRPSRVHTSRYSRSASSVRPLRPRDDMARSTSSLVE